uniref:Cadherin domain-containing protein n=1 Tax=Strigamia maritima TaxID=126957 RepID=T1J581_STRMM
MTVPTHLLWLVSAFICIPVSCVYFPLKTWHVHVPFNFPINRSLVRVVAVRRSEDAGTDWIYKIDDIMPPLHRIQVDPESGRVYINLSLSHLHAEADDVGIAFAIVYHFINHSIIMDDSIKAYILTNMDLLSDARMTTMLTKELISQNVSLTLSARRKNNNDKLDTCFGSISFIQWDSSICATRPEQACFLPVPFHVSVYEDDPAHVIASVASPLRELCSSKTVKYRYLINQAVSSYLSINQTSGELKTNTFLEHDGEEGTPAINVTVFCELSVYGEKTNFSRSFSITVLDVNDNAPLLPNGGQMDVYLDNKQLSAGSSLPLSSHIILQDLDNKRTNYSFDIIGDVEDLFEIELEDLNFGSKRGFYKKADIKLKRRLAFKGESYAVEIVFVDDDMPLRYIERQAVFNLVLHNKTIKSAISSQYNETIYANATKYTKLLGPLLKHLGNHERDLFIFSIDVIQVELKGIFNITPFHGIVYLQDPAQLSEWRNMSIKVKWDSELYPNMNNFTWINVVIISNENKNQCGK